jgi:hypothetical protein
MKAVNKAEDYEGNAGTSFFTSFKIKGCINSP